MFGDGDEKFRKGRKGVQNAEGTQNASRKESAGSILTGIAHIRYMVQSIMLEGKLELNNGG